MKDYPIEQFLRDEKAHSIFEGTNGIQALDLAGRKLGKDSEDLFKGHLEDIGKFCKRTRTTGRWPDTWRFWRRPTMRCLDVSTFLVEIQKKDFRALALYAYPYLELFGDVIVGWLLMWQAVIAQDRLTSWPRKSGIEPDAAGLEKLVAENSDCGLLQRQVGLCPLFCKHGAKPGDRQGAGDKKGGQGGSGNC